MALLSLIAAAVVLPAVHGRIAALHSQRQAWQRDSSLPCTKPERRAPVKFADNLVLGAQPNSSMYSGYVNVTDQDYLFYWLAEAEHGAAEDAPLIVWSGGGPGCSAMEGAAIETGPYVLFDVKQGSSMFPRRLTRNAYSWTRLAHVLYVDQPRYVGFSCGTGPPVLSSADAGRDMVEFLRGWRALFPEHQQRPLIFASESYGGHLVAAWASAVLDYNTYAMDPLPLRGLALGNALLNSTLQGNLALHEYQRRQQLIGEGTHASRTEAETMAAMTQHLGYRPNVYDYRLRDQECCGCTAYNYKAWADWLLMKSVTSALNVCGDAGTHAFGGCGAGCVEFAGFDEAEGPPRTLAALGRVLQEGIPVTLYYGMQDASVNYVGGFAAASALDWPGAKEFARAPLTSLEIARAPTGQVKAAAGLTWMQIDGAGHMVTVDNPAAASLAVEGLVRAAMGQDPPSLLRYT